MRVYGKPQEKLEVTYLQTVEDVEEDDARGDPAAPRCDEGRRRFLVSRGTGYRVTADY
jgi:hypothetical protein